LDSLSTPLDGVIRAGALLGYLGAFLAPLSWLNYVVFLLGRDSSQSIGSSFVHLVIRIVAWVMMAVLLGVFVWKRTRKQRALAKAKGKR